MKLNDIESFSAYVSTIYHSEYISTRSLKYFRTILELQLCFRILTAVVLQDLDCSPTPTPWNQNFEV